MECVQITMAESFGVEDRGHFYDPVGALRDVSLSITSCRWLPPRWRRLRGDPTTIKEAKVAPDRSSKPTLPTMCAASTTATSTSMASRQTRRPRLMLRYVSRSKIGAGLACHSSSHWQAPTDDPDRASACVQECALLGFGPAGHHPEANELSSSGWTRPRASG